MRKLDFLEALSEKLAGLPQIEINRSVAYYDEIIDDRIEDGMGEEAAVQALGSLDEIARTILKGIPFSPAPTADRKKRPRRGMWTVLVILGFPLWLPLIIVYYALILSLYATLWAVLITLYAAAATLAAAGPLMLASSLWNGLPGSLSGVMMYFGAGIGSLGLGLLLFPLVNQCAKWLIRFSKGTLQNMFHWFAFRK